MVAFVCFEICDLYSKFLGRSHVKKRYRPNLYHHVNQQKPLKNNFLKKIILIIQRKMLRLTLHVIPFGKNIL